ncbi:hypothetical protein B296_00054148, partial [Ensete ventricosum]
REIDSRHFLCRRRSLIRRPRSHFSLSVRQADGSELYSCDWSRLADLLSQLQYLLAIHSSLCGRTVISGECKR